MGKNRFGRQAEGLIPSFGRRGGRKLNPGKVDLLENLLPQLAITTSVDIYTLFPDKQIWLEIGFGGGEHLCHRAENNPDIGFIGCEVYGHGIAACLKNIEANDLKNIRILTEDARLLLDELPDNCLDRIFILFPDPWPKIRHHKRRIISQSMLDTLHRLLKDGGKLNLATDHMEYARWMLININSHDKFQWLADKPEDWQNPPEGHTKTRYEEKLKAGSAPVFLNFVK